MILLRSLVFHAGFYGWTCLVCIFFAPALPVSRGGVFHAALWWSRGTLALLRWVVGCRYEISGLENLPDGPAIIACKHQSVWETVAFHAILHHPVFVLKKSLAHLPVYGWYIRKLGMIAIDRAAGLAAMRHLIARGRRALCDEKRSVVIFPEGTRMAPGRRCSYHPGVAALYASARVRVVPAALNSGLFWPRRGLFIRPGTIRLKFLPPIDGGLDRRAFIALLSERIETASRDLLPSVAGGRNNGAIVNATG